jgi:hypothetical protein
MKTKHLILGLGLGVSLLAHFNANAQSGLTGVVVEKYYKANAADAAYSTDPIPAGTTVYRVYADLADGYQLQAVYGDANHALTLSTTTAFWNSSQRDAVTGENPNGQLVNGNNALDSWVTMGGAATGTWGVLKAEDNNAANILFPHNPVGLLVNAPASIGISLSTSDGMQAGTVPAVTIAGIATELAASFQSGGNNGVNLTTNNGAWSTTALDTGATASNKVLIGQFTTNGVFTFAMNFQIKNISSGTVEKWVSSSPVSGEFTLAGLSGSVGNFPTVSITAPAASSNQFVGNVINIAATAADADGTVAQVEFFRDGVSVGVDVSSAYTATTTVSSAGTHTLTAVATDNDGNTTTSSAVVINGVVNSLPTAVITAPSNAASYTGDLNGVVSSTVAITATATDSDGTVDSVAFFVDGVRIGNDLTSTYSFNWAIPVGVYGSKVLTVKSYDNNGGVTTSAAVNITITNPNAKPYFVDNASASCVAGGFSLPIKAKDAVANVIGFDLVLHYNKAKVTPTGIITAGSDLINPSYVTVSNSINTTAGTLNISVSLNNTAPNNTFFAGTGNLILVGFNKTASFGSTDTATFTIDSIVESRYTGVSSILVDPGKYITHKDSTFHGSLVFWADNSAIAGGSGTLPTVVASTTSTLTVNPDASGNFSYAVTQAALSGLNFKITRAITNTVSVQPVVNGFDALLAKKVVMKDASFVPSIYQILAMDVNQDGKISAGDVTQINQRSVLLIGEYKQAWNYNANGTPTGAGASRDWVFVDGNTLNTNGKYLTSSVYPAADGAGYTRDNVPVPATNIAAPVTNAGSCPVISNETYTGVMLGDVNGNYKDIAVDGVLRSTDASKIVFDLSKATIADGFATIPVSIESGKVINALDFAVQFINGVSYESIENPIADGLGNLNADGTLRYTSNSVDKYDVTKPVVSVKVATVNGAIRSSDLTSTAGYLNGEPATVEVKGAASIKASDLATSSVSVYPNPASDLVNVLTQVDATVELYTVNGVLVYSATAKANQILAINTQNITSGVYTLRVANDSTVSIEKVVITK